MNTSDSLLLQILPPNPLYPLELIDKPLLIAEQSVLKMSTDSQARAQLMFRKCAECGQRICSQWFIPPRQTPRHGFNYRSLWVHFIFARASNPLIPPRV